MHIIAPFFSKGSMPPYLPTHPPPTYSQLVLVVVAMNIDIFKLFLHKKLTKKKL